MHRDRGVVLTHNALTRDMRNRRIDCHDWNDLLGVAPKVGDDQDLPDFRGVEVGPRKRWKLRGRLLVRVDGRWDADSLPLAGNREEWRDNFLDALDDLYEILDVDEPVAATVHDGGTYTGQLIVEDPDRPSGRGWRAELVVAVSLPRGRLTRDGS